MTCGCSVGAETWVCGAGLNAGVCMTGGEGVIDGETGFVEGGEVFVIIVCGRGCIWDKGFLGKVAAILLRAEVPSGWSSATW